VRWKSLNRLASQAKISDFGENLFCTTPNSKQKSSANALRVGWQFFHHPDIQGL